MLCRPDIIPGVDSRVSQRALLILSYGSVLRTGIEPAALSNQGENLATLPFVYRSMK